MTKLSKYPVIAPSGELYRAVVYESSYYDEKNISHRQWMVYLYKKHRFTYKQINQPIGYYQDEYSIIAAVKDIVTKYDPQGRKSNEDKMKFQEWDGDMREMKKCHEML